MRPTYALLALLPLLFSASYVYSIPIDDLSSPDASALAYFDDYGTEDFSSYSNDEDLRGGRRIRQAVKQAVRKIIPRSPPPPKPASVVSSAPVIRLPAPPLPPVSFAIHKIVPQSEKADKVAHYISILNTDIDKNHATFMSQYNAELAKLKEISKRKLYTEEDYLKAQRDLNAKYKVWRDTLHAFSVSNATLTSLRHNGTSFAEEKNLLTHLYEYVKLFSTKQGYYKHNCVCNATLVGDLRSVQSATSLS
jgi:hypothetical protein